jgi:hypothetical protein
MYPTTRHEGAGPRTIKYLRSAFGSRNASRTLTRLAVRCVVAANVRERAAGRAPWVRPSAGAVEGLVEPEGLLEPYPLDGGVALVRAGAGAPTVSVVVVAGCGDRGAGAGRVGAGEGTTGGRRTGGGAVVVGGGAGTVGTVTVGAGREGTVGVVVVGTGSDGTLGVGTVTVGTGTSMALPCWTSTCAQTKPPNATTKRTSLPNLIKPQTSDQQSALRRRAFDVSCGLG